MIRFLVRRFPYQNEDGWLECIRAGEIKLNEKKASPHTVLKSKDTITYQRPREKEPKIDATYSILYLDASIVLVEKSGNIPIAESGRYHQNTLINVLKEREGYPELFTVHRLDKETSGVVMIARTKAVATQLGEQFIRQVPEKIYYAVLVGEMKQGEVLVDEPLRKSTPDRSKVRIRQIVDPDGKPSKTHFSAEKVHGGLTLARIRTFSGRTHQIRCHAEYIGYPILGDKLYGHDDDYFISILKGDTDPDFPPFGRIDRQLLHASSLSIDHPETGNRMTFRSDYRAEFGRYPAVKDWLLEISGRPIDVGEDQ
ncbi:MAG: RluA family pseudouridine synthase [Proteobacteria bacterium]|nr:RluA family pseudouridine synthase [Pseudomonadota bacterium]